MWGPEGMMSWGWTGFGFLPMLLFWALVIAGIAMLVRWLALGTPSSRPGRAQQILEERYAKGELTREQFLKMKADL